jgi:hypothetical protein
MSVTLTSLLASARQRSDMVNSLFISDSELTSYINSSMKELYDLMITAYGSHYFVSATPQSITTDGINETFALASDMYKVIGVDLQVNGTLTNWVTLRPFEFTERNSFLLPIYAPTPTVTWQNIWYCLMGSNIMLRPKPRAGQVLQIHYIPLLTDLSTGTDALFNTLSGWEEYIIIDAAIKCLQKEESDVSILLTQKLMLKKRIESLAHSRDVGQPHRVVDISSSYHRIGQINDGWW